MNISMLGHSGVGKTTFMASMYAAFQNSVKGFSVSAVNAEEHARLLASAVRIRSGEYPGNTEQRVAYAFSLHHNGASVLPFNWTDHRGDAVFEESAGSDEVTKLVEDLAKANAILVFFACDALSAGRTSPRYVRRMVALIAGALAKRTEPAVLVIVLTKADLASKIDDELVEPLETLVECVSSSREVLGTVVPVACGRETTNVLLPAIFALRVGIVQKYNTTVKEADRSASMIKKLDDEGDSFSGMFGAVRDWFNGAETVYKRAERWRGYLRSEVALLERLGPAADELEEYVTELPRF